ncbi:hypothetical protein E2C01_038987 [Portunus trituberculatus]|uniref:Uncharacterized protein n=1 Tax=Portunus trituberculatus TaxID=210409 RepID=A0A5B7FFM4_PORTR|nr:hypothetical protein [Portunus trituberculatus]
MTMRHTMPQPAVLHHTTPRPSIRSYSCAGFLSYSQRALLGSHSDQRYYSCLLVSFYLVFLLRHV